MARERVEREAAAPQAEPHITLSVAELRQLIALMNGSDIEEITIEHEAAGLHLTLRKPAPLAPSAALAGVDYEPVEVSDTARSDEASSERAAEVRASLVGVFRAAMASGAQPMAVSGDVVRQGQVLGAIESLNVLNEVEASTAGRVKQVLVGDGQAVEYGQPLVIIEPLSI